MYKVIKRRGLRLVLAVGLCLGMLATTEAIWGEEEPEDTPCVLLAEPPIMEKSEEELILEADAAQRSHILALLDGQGLAAAQRDVLCTRLAADQALLRLLEQGELTGADLAYLALPNGWSHLLDRYSAWAAEHPEDSLETVVLQVNMDQDLGFYNQVQVTPDPNSPAVLVNKHYVLPEGFVPELEVLGSTYGIGSLHPVAAQAFRTMADAARADGISLRSVSSYRSYERQEELYTRYLKQYRRQTTVDTFSARPGYSEHQTGLALDINVASVKANFESTPAFAWLKAHCAQYGFILRYDQGKNNITGYRFEPWHYRYVGVEAAAACMEQGLAYEEYLALQPAF